MIDCAFWGQGSRARLLPSFSTWCLFGPSDNAGSLRVLLKARFRILGTEVSFAPGRGAEIEETILQLP